MKKILIYILLLLIILNLGLYGYIKLKSLTEKPVQVTQTAPNTTTDTIMQKEETEPYDETSKPKMPLSVLQKNSQLSEKTQQKEIVKFIKTTQITPDSNFSDGGLGYIHYVPATDTLIVMIATKLDASVYGCGKGLVYKEYTTDMKETGKYGMLLCVGADVTTTLIDNDLLGE